MSSYERLLQIIGETRDKLDELEKEVMQLQVSDSDLNPQGRSHSETQDQDTASPFDLTRVVPPTKTADRDSIVGGSETKEYPDCCAVGNDQDYTCSGTLIAPTIVVTAKHCEGLTRVFLGGYYIQQSRNSETIGIAKHYAHPTADLQILVLEHPSKYPPRHVAQGLEVRATAALLVGFGTVDFDGTVGYGKKREVEVPIHSLGCTSESDIGQYGCQKGKEIVAGHRGLNLDSCRGDSGGPLYIKGPDGSYYLLGATSRGLGGPRKCGDGGIYVRVDQYLDWIFEKTGVEIEGPLI